MHVICNRALGAVACLLVLATAACSSTVATDAADLGKQGQAAASSAQQAVTLSSDQFAAYKDSNAFLHGYVGVAATGLSPDQERLNQDELTRRAKLFASLGALYASFGNLASYDASAQVQANITTLSTNVDAYRIAVGQAKTGPAAVSPAAAGNLAGLMQDQMIVALSEQIRGQLTTLITLMSDPQFRAQFVATKTLVVSQLVKNARLLMDDGLLSPKPYFDEMGQPLGLTAADDVAAALKDQPLARAGLDAVVAAREGAAIDAVGASYDASLAALKALLPLHAKLEAGQPLDLTQIDQIVRQLQAIAAAAAPPAKGAN